MRNKMKSRSILSLLLCVSMIVTALSFTFTVSADPVTVYSEDFEGFDVSDDWVTIGNPIVDGWSASASSGEPLNVNPTGKIVDVNGNKKLAITGVSASNYVQYLQRQGIILFQGTELRNLSNCYKIKFSFEKKSVRSGLGIKFNLSPDKASYYYLYIPGEDSINYLWAFLKVDKGSISPEREFCEETFSTYNSSPGSITDGDVEIIVDGNRISWTITGHRYNKVDVVTKGSFYDKTGFSMAPSSCYMAFGAKYKDNSIYIDNFVVENVERYVDFQPSEILYKNLSSNTEENVFDDSYVIRRIQALDLANQTVDIQLSGELSDATVSAKFDSNGLWINNDDYGMYNKVVMPTGFVYDDLLILTEYDGEMSDKMYSGEEKTVMYPVTNNEMDPANFVWTSSDTEVAEVTNGRVTALKSGEAKITATVNEIEYVLNVTVLGELDGAIEKNKISEYLADKKPVIDAINSAIAAGDASALKAIITSTGDVKLNYIKDIETKEIDSLTSSQLDDYIDRLLTYPAFTLDSIDDVKKLQDILDSEIIVGTLNNLSDTATIESILEANAETLGIDLTSKYYLSAKEDTLKALCNTKFENIQDVKEKFSEVYIMQNFKDAAGTTVLRALIKECLDEIGANKTHFTSVDTEEMYEYLMGVKSSITTLNQLKNIIDSYVKPTPGSYAGGPGNGSNGVTRAGTKTTSDPVIASPDVKAKAEEPVEIKDVPLFSDVTRDDWFYPSLEHLKGIGVIDGYEDGTFRHENNVTRAEFVKILMTACGLGDFSAKTVQTAKSEDEIEEEVIFEDVTLQDWFYKYLIEAYKNGIVYGDTNSRCYPDDYITREEMCLMLYRAALKVGKYLDDEYILMVFADDSSISDWAYTAVIKLKNSGFVAGYEDGTFKPWANATRAEVAALVSKFITHETVDPATLIEAEEGVEGADEK
ncbi:MAG: S-layer homology domain-containing protein [Clostridia bacterium]|nr:S-layer homology domain-containing protein [Clostridia bacterium]